LTSRSSSLSRRTSDTMPKTRVPRGPGASTVRLEDLEEEKQKAYYSILEDFDKQFQQHIDNIHKDKENLFEQLDKMTRMAVLSVPKADRKKPYLEWAPKLDFNRGQKQTAAAKSDNGKKVMSEMEKVLKEVNQKVEAQVRQTVRSSRKQRGPPRSASASNVGKTPAQANKGTMEPPTTGVRRSARKRTQRALEAETPGSAMRRGGVSAPSLLTTPMITPKFDLTTPVSRTVMRLAKPDETLVSLSGSPVYAGASTAKTSRRGGGKASAATASAGDEGNVIAIPLGKGRTVMLPISGAAEGAQATAPPSTAKRGRGKKATASTAAASGGSLDLDDGDRQKLLSINAQLEKMLNL